ncbi:hypothetical protein Fmac_012711 [Flemingia macrophylla]|uniref:Uncharacterized protein n=1 Tax=Flemingia macrophylla TaxID=520843 RepID=A0ABD1MR21_9FABA
MKVKANAAGSNPFESIWSQRKFEVLGQKRKGEAHRMGLSHSLSIHKRNDTLFQEYRQSTKSNLFLNTKLSKKSMYHLSDGEEDDFEGIDSLGRDDFEQEMFPDDDVASEADEQLYLVQRSVWIPREIDAVNGEENRHKSKKEVMEEIISSSKFFKAQKAKDMEENEHLVEELDKDFTSLVHSEALLSWTEPNKMKALKALVNKSISNKQSNKDNYMSSRTMDTSIKAAASNPVVVGSNQELSAGGYVEERHKRINVAEDSSDEENEDSEKLYEQKPRSISGDNLGDSFSVNEQVMIKKVWVDEILESKDDYEDSDDLGSPEDGDEGLDEDLDENKKELSVKDWKQSDDDDIGADSKYGNEDDSDGDKEIATEDLDEVEGLDVAFKKRVKSNVSLESVKKDKDSSYAKKIEIGGKQSKRVGHSLYNSSSQYL